MTLAQKSTEVIRHERRAGNTSTYLVLGLITLAVIALAVAFATSQDRAETTAATRTVAEVEPTSAFSQEQIMMDLATKGYIPMASVDWEAMALREAVSQGYVPEQALRSYYSAGVEPLFTQEELASIELAEKGLIPMESVNWEDVELKRLANKGLIPYQAAP